MKFSIVSLQQRRLAWKHTKRIIGRRNLWDKMKKVKQKIWMSVGKEIQLNTGNDVLTSKATTSLFARMLVIARSSRECRSGRGD